MSKYRGKYKKCRSCAHVLELLNVLVRVKDTCPKAKAYTISDSLMVDKFNCEDCEFYEEVKADATEQATDSD